MNPEILNLLLNIGAASLVPMAASIAAYFGQKLKVGALDINTKKWQQTQLIINAAIMSAQQGDKVGILATSTDKKKHAMELAKTLLAKQKIKIEEEVLSQLIEANVWETKNAPSVNPIVIPSAVISQPEVVPEVRVGDIINNAVG
jgi:predicted RNA-binding protein